MGTTAAQMQKRQQPPEGGPLGQEDPASREPAANLVPSATNHSFTTSFQPLRTRGDSAPTARCYGWGPSRPVPVNHTPVRSSLSSCFAPISKPCAGYVYCHELQAGSGESCTENFVNFSFPWLHAPPTYQAPMQGVLAFCPRSVTTDTQISLQTHLLHPEQHPGLRPLEHGSGPQSDAGMALARL